MLEGGRRTDLGRAEMKEDSAKSAKARADVHHANLTGAQGVLKIVLAVGPWNSCICTKTNLALVFHR